MEPENAGSVTRTMTLTVPSADPPYPGSRTNAPDAETHFNVRTAVPPSHLQLQSVLTAGSNSSVTHVEKGFQRLCPEDAPDAGTGTDDIPEETCTPIGRIEGMGYGKLSVYISLKGINTKRYCRCFRWSPMVMPQNLLESSINKQISILLKDGRIIKGKLTGYDEYMNMVLEGAEEEKGEEKKRLGTLILRGNNIVSITPA